MHGLRHTAVSMCSPVPAGPGAAPTVTMEFSELFTVHEWSGGTHAVPQGMHVWQLHWMLLELAAAGDGALYVAREAAILTI